MIKNKRLSKTTAVFTPGSSMTRQVNYSSASKRLEVHFTSGRVYQYLNVPEKLWNEYQKTIASGLSSGKFINGRIIPFYDFIAL